MGFPTSGLAISKNSSIVSIENVLYQRKRRLFVDLLLGGILAKHVIIGKMFDSGIERGNLFESNLMSDFIYDDDIFTVCFNKEKDLFRFISYSWDGNVPLP